MMQVVKKLKANQNRESTKANYYSIWKTFNQFLIRLDYRPPTWEERTTLYCAYLVENKRQSSTVKSYVSAIKSVLVTDGYNWDDRKVLLGAITRACCLKNDIVKTRLPICGKLLELILFELSRIFRGQPYLYHMYRALFAISYYGLMRIGELTRSQHVIWASSVHLALNKRKLLLVLYSSKTHGKESRPQKIKLSAASSDYSYLKTIHFCPFTLTANYLIVRGGYELDNEQFFVFSDGRPVFPSHAREVLNKCLINLGLNSQLYGTHSLRIGRATDMLKNNETLDKIRRVGRWRSNAVFKYLKD